MAYEGSQVIEIRPASEFAEAEPRYPDLDDRIVFVTD